MNYYFSFALGCGEDYTSFCDNVTMYASEKFFLLKVLIAIYLLCILY